MLSVDGLFDAEDGVTIVHELVRRAPTDLMQMTFNILQQGKVEALRTLLKSFDVRRRTLRGLESFFELLLLDD